MFISRNDAESRSYLANLGSYLRAADFTGDFSAHRDLVSDNIVLRFTVLGQPEVLRFDAGIDLRGIAQAVWQLRDSRENEVGPEFHMAQQLARRNSVAVDPYGRHA